MGGSGGGGQAIVQTGPTPQAASAAAQAQVAAAQQASEAATANTNNAINALMGEYGTALQYQQPAAFTGNQAMAQLNYMLGLNAVAPGSAPTAPTMPTLASAEQKVSNADLISYLDQNSIVNGSDNGFAHQTYVGAGSEDPALTAWANGGWDVSGTPSAGMSNPGGVTLAQNLQETPSGASAFYTNPTIKSDATADIANQNLQNNLLPAYQQQLTTYNQQNDAWNQENNIYNTYKAKGTATSADIGDIVQNLPGYQFQLGQGISGIQNAASANGMLNSGSLLRGLDQYGQGLASNYYQNYLQNLQGLAGMGTNANNQISTAAQNTGAGVANQYGNLGTDQANSYLAAGQAMASSYLSPLSSQQTQVTNVGGGGGSGLGGLGGLLSGAGSLLSAYNGIPSSEKLKDKIETPNTEELLDRVERLTIDKWKYKGIDAEHIGPYAEQFKELFNVGDGKSINIIDMFGVMLGSIKELSSQIKELKKVK